MKQRNFSKKETKKACLTRRQGFSLVEVLISLFIFSLAISLLTGSFGSFFLNYSNTRKLQKDVEDAQFASNIMAKTIRTSDVVAISGGIVLDTLDYSQTNGCIRYQKVGAAASGKIQSVITAQTNATKVGECVWGVSDVTSDLTSNIITNFNVTATASSPGSKGLVTFVLSVKDPKQTGSGVSVQSSVSLRQ